MATTEGVVVVGLPSGTVTLLFTDVAGSTFADASDAIDAAVVAQLAFAVEAWAVPESLRVRMGIHSGPAELRDGDYHGTAVNRAEPGPVAVVGHKVWVKVLI